MRLHFQGREQLGVGVAIELQVVDQETRFPAPAAPSLLELLHDEPSIRPDLFQSLIEVETGIYPTVEEVGRELHRLVDKVRAVCDAHGLTLLASGTHPVAGWRDLHLTHSPWAEAFIRRLQWVGRRAAVFGLRIHVGVPDGEKAIAIGNSVTSLVPLLVALGASSPFWRGFDTGLASARTRVIENIPNAGLPPNLLNFGEFQAYVRTLRAAETIDGIHEIWWDVRPNLRLGTLEFQACDMPHTLREVLALAAFAQAVVAWLLHNYEQGDVIPYTESWLVRENKWRATRFGLDAELVTGNDCRLSSVREVYEGVVSMVGDYVSKLGLERHFSVLEEFFRIGPGYLRQRRVAQRLGVPQVPFVLSEELLRDQPSMLGL